VNEHDQLLVKVSEDIGKLTGVLERLTKLVEGNGQPGLAQRVAVLEARHYTEDGGKEERTHLRVLYSSLLLSLGNLVAMAYHIVDFSHIMQAHIH
jgi:hypothetical protein